MRILAVSDEECPALWDYYTPGKLDDCDLILGCGDLKASYLSFLVTMSHCRLLYVPGNHDEGYDRNPPDGCDNIDGHLVEYNGIRILGFGGCMRYRPGSNQYSEGEMARRVRAVRRALKRSGGVDIVIAHAPPKGIGDLEDPAHTGFKAFVDLIDEFRPALFLHGHTHLRYLPSFPRERTRGETRVINVSERVRLDIPDRPFPPERRGDLIWKTRRRESGSGRLHPSVDQ